MIAKEYWYAAGGGIALSGPYASQREAYEAMRLTVRAREEQHCSAGVDMPYPRDIVVWPTYKLEK